ncbi:MAG: 30S ribosomal protein S8 [archaeon]
MAQDVVSDGLNMIMNAKRIGKKELTVRIYSKVLIGLYEIMKKEGYIDFEVNKKEETIKVKIIKLNLCRAIKPRYHVTVGEIDKYLRRFLPSRNFGSMILSTNQGLINYKEAYENKIGGSLIAYFY